ncbi:Speckle-type POZ protein [Hordeum vulgare]|nr:Speckle-type POZ protein [Hordeum vulgare]
MAQQMMSTAITPFARLGINIFKSCAVALRSTSLDSFRMSGMEPKFEHTSMVLSNLLRSPFDHSSKKVLRPIPQGKGLALELELELMAMERRKIEERNEMGTEVLPAIDKKGKADVHPMPEVVLPPTAKEEPKKPMRVTVKLMNGMVTLDQGWATFAAVHRINIGYMVTFKLLTPDTLKVIIFDDDGIEVVNKCGKHDEAFIARD